MKYLVLLIAFVLAGCATPMGQLKDSDFNIEQRTINYDIGYVYDYLQKYSRTCGGLINYRTSEFNLSFDRKSANIDMYMTGLFDEKMFVYGLIEIKQDGLNTNLTAKVTNRYSKSSWINSLNDIVKQIDSKNIVCN